MTHMKTTVVMPAYNAALTLERTIADIPLDHVHELILVDDASKDDTVVAAQRLAESHPRLVLAERSAEFPEHIPFLIHQLESNKGYGGNQKKCYELALSRGADIVVMVHPDFQYDPKMVKPLAELLQHGHVDVMLGSRIRSMREALEGGMPWYKYLANRFLSTIENIATGQNLAEWHSGMRAYTADALRSVDFSKFSDDFVFDTQMLFALIEKKNRIGDIPVPTRYFEEASSINLKRSTEYALLNLVETARYIGRNILR